MCDFSQGFQEPEMIKTRPVIVVSPRLKGRANLVTVVALSAVEPHTIMPYHFKLPRNCMPMLRGFQDKDSWVKGDMIYSVGFHRLDLITLGSRNRQTGKREYFARRLGREHMESVYACILCGLGMSHLVESI